MSACAIAWHMPFDDEQGHRLLSAVDVYPPANERCAGALLAAIRYVRSRRLWGKRGSVESEVAAKPPPAHTVTKRLYKARKSIAAPPARPAGCHRFTQPLRYYGGLTPPDQPVPPDSIVARQSAGGRTGDGRKIRS